jgi:hypothetical protein
MGRKNEQIEARVQEYTSKFKEIITTSSDVADCYHKNRQYHLASQTLFQALEELDSLDGQYKDVIRYMGGFGRRRDESISKSDREYIIKKYKYQCAYCGKKGDKTHGPDGATWQIDHIIPYSWEGATERGNFALACRRCNCKKHDKWWFPNAKALQHL